MGQLDPAGHTPPRAGTAPLGVELSVLPAQKKPSRHSWGRMLPVGHAKPGGQAVHAVGEPAKVPGW